MTVEQTRGLRARAAVHAALGEPVRLAIADRLLLGDASPGEIGRELGLPSNLLAHHVRLLEAAGVVGRTRSEGDRRRAYLQLLPAALAELGPRAARSAPRVVFVCTFNSARSQLAAAMWRRRSTVPAASAGTRPAREVHPRAVAVARRHGVSLAGARTAHVSDVVQPDDLVIAVCDNAHEQLGDQARDRLHWSVPDPARIGTEDAFVRALHEIAVRVDHLAPAVTTGGVDE